MFTRKHVTIRHKAFATILATMGWLSLALCWTGLAWGHYSLFQHLAGLGISTLLFAAIAGTMWVVDLGWVFAGTVLTTLGWLSFALYWIGFVWSQRTLLQNGAALMVSLLAGVGILVVLWQRERADECC